jgi:predicted Zn finger-like uncharacterized protein
MIIQCPQCHTKFALDASLVDQLDEPRFHCSRCDNVFNFDETSPSIKPISSSAPGPIQSTAQRPAPHSQGELPLPASPTRAEAYARETGNVTTAPALPFNRAEAKAQNSLTRSVPIPAPSASHRGITAPHEQALSDHHEQALSDHHEQALSDHHEQALNDYFDNDPDEPEAEFSEGSVADSSASDGSISEGSDSDGEAFSAGQIEAENEIREHEDREHEEPLVESPDSYESSSDIENPPISTLEMPEGAITPLIPSHLKQSSALPSSSLSSSSLQRENESPVPHVARNYPSRPLQRDLAPTPMQEPEVPEPIHSSSLNFLDPTATPAPSRSLRASELSRTALESSASVEDPYRSLSSQYEPLRRNQINPSWRGLALIGLPMAAALMLFAVLGFTLRANPELATAISRKAFPAAPQVAPNELYIKNTKFRKVLLDSGESVYVVSGKVLNDSSSTFRDVMVEGILFDANGAALLRTKASASSGLAKGRIRSMTPEIISRTQLAATPPDYRMPTGDSQEFALVMDAENAAQAVGKARYFSARIYSVKY